MKSIDKLAICVVGYPDSGKSETWYSLFGTKVKRGKYERELCVFEDPTSSKKEYANVFLINGSPQESGEIINDMIPITHPQIILCSLQYIEGKAYAEGLFDSVKWLENSGYDLFVLWLNPGYNNDFPYLDNLGLFSRIQKNDNNLIGRRNGNHNPENRAEEIRNFIYGWSKPRGLTF